MDPFTHDHVFYVLGTYYATVGGLFGASGRFFSSPLSLSLRLSSLYFERGRQGRSQKVM